MPDWQAGLPQKVEKTNRYRNAVRLDDETHEVLMQLRNRLGHSAMAIVKALIEQAEKDTRRENEETEV